MRPPPLSPPPFHDTPPPSLVSGGTKYSSFVPLSRRRFPCSLQTLAESTWLTSACKLVKLVSRLTPHLVFQVRPRNRQSPFPFKQASPPPLFHPPSCQIWRAFSSALHSVFFFFLSAKRDLPSRFSPKVVIVSSFSVFLLPFRY